MRAAVVGGTAYAAGKHNANRSNQKTEQEARLNELEQQQAAGAKGGATTPAPVALSADVTTRLKELTEAEFTAAKQKILTG
jgi:hypothetical protein